MKPASSFRRIGRRFFSRDPRIVAPELIGHGLVRRVQDTLVGGVIVETEAYLSTGDLASHSRSGMTRRCQSMFAAAGTLYVYSIHAKYCMNVVTEKHGVGSAVLIRALEPVWGIAAMQHHRGQTELHRLTRGPAMLCQALGITTREDGLDLVTSDEVYLIHLPSAGAEVGSSSRIGISAGNEHPFRFYQRGSRFVSGTVKQRA
ncbi:MAG: DNA-3-methyladenine glycosylase [Planctomycetaceae bacterium]